MTKYTYQNVQVWPHTDVYGDEFLVVMGPDGVSDTVPVPSWDTPPTLADLLDKAKRASWAREGG